MEGTDEVIVNTETRTDHHFYEKERAVAVPRRKNAKLERADGRWRWAALLLLVPRVRIDGELCISAYFSRPF